ncbi:hypothetical protein MNBD_GAMMA16-2140 [hydrothermal vent metagenome]|uniref:Uncharacterized protein n=1 Tax=hydrothermal vent metagenome TaxID=652676 RepID=A0A3B0ZH13_9ZZZZ
MINVHPTLYYLLIEALAVFILLSCFLSFLQIKQYLQRKKTLINLVSRLKDNKSQRKEELFRLLKEQGTTDEEQLETASNGIIKNETVFYQYIVHALVNIDLNQIADLDKHVEVLINSTTKTNLENKAGANSDIEQISSGLSELRTTVQEIREGQFQLMDVLAHTPVPTPSTPITDSTSNESVSPSKINEEPVPDSSPSDTEGDEIEALEMDFDDFDAEPEAENIAEVNEEITEPLEKPEEPQEKEAQDEKIPASNIEETNDSIDDLLSEVQAKEISADSPEDTVSTEPESENTENDNVNPDDIIDSMQTQSNAPVDKAETPDEKETELQTTNPVTENDIDSILDAELNSTETDPEKSLGIDIDTLIEEVADENRSVLMEKSEPQATKEKPNTEKEGILDELNNIEPVQAEETTHQGIEGASGLAEELEELLK